MALLLVHGRSQQGKDPMVLKSQWLKGLRSGIERCQGKYPRDTSSVFFPYYGDLLIEALNRHPGDDHYIADRKDVSSEEAEVLRELERDFRAKAGEQGATKSLAAVARIADLFPGASDLVLGFMRDAAAYLGRDDVRKQVHGVVQPALAEAAKYSQQQNEPLIVLGHSLGSVVMHNILSTLPPVAEVDLFVTVGSPLGSPAVYKKLSGARERSYWPQGVKAWLNVSDRDDVVAIKSTLGRSNLFRDGKSSDRTDVLNLVDVENTSDNHHGIAEYLSDPGVARGVTQLLWGTWQ